MRGLAACAALVLCASLPARAFESSCRSPLDYPNRGADGGYEAAICCFAAPSTCANPDAGNLCPDGWGFARGAQLSEHTWLADRGMRRAGLTPYATDTGAFDYYVGSYNAFGSPPGAQAVPTVEPSGPGGMQHHVSRVNANIGGSFFSRLIALPEFAQSVDGSHSFSDFVLGNEHCMPPLAVPPALLADGPTLNACHTFASHMGSVNSTHFPPQALWMYQLYHSLALDVAAQCAQAQTVYQDAGPHPLGSVQTAQVAACEREALALQAAAAHFQGDAWSSGHMWQRWGTPNFAPLADVRRLKAQTVSITAGLIHGWKSVLLSHHIPVWQQDRMCMPGPYSDETDTTHYTRWTYPDAGASADAGWWFGAGDLYLLDCEAAVPTWSLEKRPELLFQRNRMLSCIARGFAEVYDKGPKTQGLRLPPAFEPNGSDDGAIATSLDDACWSPRVTNASLLEGARASEFRINDTRITSRIVINIAPSLAAFTGETSVSVADVYALQNKEFPDALTSLAKELKVRAARNPYGTDAADLDDSVVVLDAKKLPRKGPATKLGQFLGVDRNGSAANVAIFDAGVPYLENPSRATWSVKPSTLKYCFSDSDCVSQGLAGDYCDRVSFAAGAQGSYCVRNEGAVLKAFHGAETPYFCSADGRDELDAANQQCIAAAASGSDPCLGCASIAAPHLAQACDAPSYRQFVARAGAASVGSQALCGLFPRPGSDAGVTLLYQMASLDGGITPEAFCETPGAVQAATRSLQADGGQVAYDGDPLTPPAATSLSFASVLASPTTETHYACSATATNKWWHFTSSDAPVGTQPPIYEFWLTAQPMSLSDGTDAGDGIFVTTYADSACANPLFSQEFDVASPAAPIDWSVPDGGGDYCLQVSSSGWSQYQFTLAACEPIGHACQYTNECCSGLCDGTSSQCCAGPPTGTAPPQACQTKNDCCGVPGGNTGIDCDGGLCCFVGVSVDGVMRACTTGQECCSGNCVFDAVLNTSYCG